MHLRLFHKLFLAIAAASLASILALAVGANWYLHRSFLRFLTEERAQHAATLAAELGAWHAEHGDWDTLRGDRRAWRRIVRDALRDRLTDERPPRAPGREHDRDARLRGIVLLDAARNPVIGPPRVPADLELVAVTASERTVGWLGLPPLRRPRGPREQRFARRQLGVLSFGSAIACVLSIGVAWMLARRLAAPIRDIGATAQALTAGDFTARVAAPGGDELGRLGTHVNVLARTLERNESSRRRFFADVSHELRTPLAILRGEIEAARDGVHPLDAALLRSLDEETARLERLIEDLHQLARADLGALDYAFREAAPAAVVSDCLQRFAPRLEAAGLSCTRDLDAGVRASLDARRLAQLVENLLENCVRYVPAPGTIDVTLRADGPDLELVVADTGAGPGTADLEQLFEPLTRGEDSRSRAHGGAGLGLAIARRIAEAHGGTLRARRADPTGLEIVLRMPRSTPA